MTTRTATNKNKILVTESFSAKGRALLTARDDVEMIEFPNMISAADFSALLKSHAPVHGVALGATRFGEPELLAAGDMKVVTRIGVGFDAVDVPALSKHKVPLMVAGTANSPSVAEQALFMMLTLAKRAQEQGRSDDTPEAIAKRLATYAKETAPLLDTYKSRGQLVAIDGVGDIDAIQANIVAALSD